MKLPNREKAVVRRSKIVNYLLSATHQDGQGKANFFIRFGFSTEAWQILAEALRQHTEYEVVKIEDSPYGIRYVIEGELQTPDGRSPQVRSIWFIETEKNQPSFVTAYPLRKRGK